MKQTFNLFQESAENLESNANKLFKLPKDRRTLGRITDYEKTGNLHWKAVCEYNQIISNDENASKEYFAKYENVKQIFEKFTTKVKLFKEDINQQDNIEQSNDED